MSTLNSRPNTFRGRAKRLEPVGRPGANGEKRKQAYQQLRRLLILQQIPAGSRLKESQWTAQTGVEPTALREAFSLLEAEGLIDFGERTGYVVPAATPRDVHEVVEVRCALEGSAIEIICREGLNTPEHLKRSLDTCTLMEQLLDNDYRVTTVEADHRFHDALVEASGNERLLSVYRRAPLPILHPAITWGRAWAERVERSIHEHKAILKAVFEGEDRRARDLLRAHLASYWTNQDDGCPGKESALTPAPRRQAGSTGGPGRVDDHSD